MIDQAAQQLWQYGVLGIWTIVNLFLLRWFMQKSEAKEAYYNERENKQQERFAQVVENNTVALTRVYEVVRSCPQKN